ncbi:MAG: hypothetical protein LBS61_03350 [Endomicrobium sp.]|jgi:multidrug efflux pump subunit AcrB|nr:hypothetical protein [Endomicrobium sp.]
MKKVTSMLLVFVLLVSPMKSVFAYKDETKEVCEDTETTWQRVKRKASETKQWILENKVKSAIMFASVVGGGIVIYYKRDRIKEFFFPTDVRPDHQPPPQGDGPEEGRDQQPS